MSDYHVIINPVSGQKHGLRIFSKIKPLLSKNGKSITGTITCDKDHARQLIKELPLDGYRGIIVIGGDGTIHEVINGMMCRADGKILPLGLVPAGTGNSLCHDLGIKNPEQAIQIILDGALTSCDLFELTMREEVLYSFNVVSWGIPVDINTQAEKLRWLKGQRYNIASIIQIFRNVRRRVVISLGDQRWEGMYSLVIACNTIHTGNGMRIAPNAIINDHKIDLLILKKMNSLHLLSLFIKIFRGQHLPHPDISYTQVDSFQIDGPERLPLNIDGETKGSTPVQVKYAETQIPVFAVERRD